MASSPMHREGLQAMNLQDNEMGWPITVHERIALCFGGNV